MVIVRYRRDQWTVRPGESLSIGRSRTCVVRLPEDDHLSRRASTLQVLDDCVLVFNDSQHKPLVVRPPVGEDRVVEPGAATASSRHPEFGVLFVGRGGVVEVVEVDARGLAPARLHSTSATTRAPDTITRPTELTVTQRRVLLALCAPMLTQAGPRACPATYAEIGRRLDRQPQYIRNVIKSVRESLSGHGVPGLTGVDESARQEDFRWALARWAIRSGWVDAGELHDLPPEPDADSGG
jgi:hypothetical protein